jgi:hypothetical protein
MARLRFVLLAGLVVLATAVFAHAEVVSYEGASVQQPPAPQQPRQPPQPPPPHYPLPADPQQPPADPGRDPAPPTAEPRRDPPPDDAAASQQPARGTPPPDCEQMMAEHKRMVAEEAQMDKALHSLLVQLNAAEGEAARLDALTAVVNELVVQRIKSRTKMAEMQERMMGHMGQHMQSGDAAAMAKCPMMQMRHPARERQ